MISSNELRIGNYIKSDDGIICEVSKIESKEFTKWDSGEDHSILCKVVGTKDDYLNCINDNWKPIPLTKDILLKCGFDGINGWYKREGIDLFTIRDLYFRGNFPIKSDIKHLHQLQNLYFALTGTELTIKGL